MSEPRPLYTRPSPKLNFMLYIADFVTVTAHRRARTFFVARPTFSACAAARIRRSYRSHTALHVGDVHDESQLGDGGPLNLNVNVAVTYMHTYTHTDTAIYIYVYDFEGAARLLISNYSRLRKSGFTFRLFRLIIRDGYLFFVFERGNERMGFCRVDR